MCKGVFSSIKNKCDQLAVRVNRWPETLRKTTATTAMIALPTIVGMALSEGVNYTVPQGWGRSLAMQWLAFLPMATCAYQLMRHYEWVMRNGSHFTLFPLTDATHTLLQREVEDLTLPAGYRQECTGYLEEMRQHRPRPSEITPPGQPA